MARVTRRSGDLGAAAPRIGRFLSFLGCALSVQATPAAAQVTTPVPPSPGGQVAAAPWSAVGRKSPLPPTRARVTLPPVRHPAIHPLEVPMMPGRPLFPRLDDVQRQRQLRQEAMKRHPAGKGLKPASPQPVPEPQLGAAAPAKPGRVRGQEFVVRRGSVAQANEPSLPESTPPSGDAAERVYRVRPGDSLWRIASSIEGPGASPSEVAALTNDIFEMNERQIGDNPDLIHPGQSLSLPEEHSK